MRIATWNVNSIKAHLEQVLNWLRTERPEVLCLQEIKCEDAAFPTSAFSELGYSCAVHGQKTYNGVALLSLLPLEDIARGLPGDASDEQARFIAATVVDGGLGVRVHSLYLPNGNPAPGPKYDFKLSWMRRLEAAARLALGAEEPAVFAGDFNVIPAAQDAKNPKDWERDALYLPTTRAAFQQLLNVGYRDSYRELYPLTLGAYSFWDYQAGAWPKNNGIRIDHLLVSPQAADLLRGAKIHKDVRGDEKPSDHVPVEITLAK